jgi:hypothetical protein
MSFGAYRCAAPYQVPSPSVTTQSDEKHAFLSPNSPREEIAIFFLLVMEDGFEVITKIPMPMVGSERLEVEFNDDLIVSGVSATYSK